MNNICHNILGTGKLNGEFMSKEELFKRAAKSLEETTGIRTEVKNPKKLGAQPGDGQIKIHAPQIAGEFLLNLNVKKNLTNAALGNLAVEQAKQPEKMVLVADYVTPEQADRLRQAGIPFFDAAGNVYFNEPGLFVFVSGKKGQSEKEKPLRLFRPVSLKVLFLLLADPKSLNHDYRQIAERTGVSLGAVGETFNDLRKNRYLLLPGKNERTLTRIPELLKRWVEAYINKMRINLRVGRFRTDKFQGRWWEDVNIQDFRAAWGGEIAAEKLTDYLNPETVTVYADSPIPQFQARFGLRRDENGNIEIIEKFWQMPEIKETVHPLIVYADLLATNDERNLETARIIYENEITRLTGETAR